MVIKMVTRTLAVVVALAVLAAPALADTKRRVVVLRFSGPAKHARKAHKTVVKTLRGEYEIVPIRKYNKARNRLDARKPTKKNFSRIARAVGLDAIVSGEVRRRGKRLTLKVTVREGISGKTLDTFRVPMRNKRITRDDVADDLFDLIAWAEPIGEKWERALPAPEREERPVAEPEPEPATDPAPDAEDAWDEPVAPEPGDELTAETSVDLPPRAAGPTAQVRAGMSFVGRDLTFSHQASLMPEQQPTTYDGGVVGSILLQGEMYPSRLLDSPPAAEHLDRVAVRFELDNAVGLESQYTDDSMTTHNFATSQRRWGLGLGYTLDLGKPTVQIGAGYNQLRHRIDNGAVDIGLPDVNYKYVDIGGRLGYAITDELVALGGLKYLAVIGAGEIVTAAAYGEASVSGLDLDAGAEYSVTDRIAVRGGLRYLRMAFDFAGNGDMSTGLDGDPDQDVGGATDQYLGFYLLGGYVF